MTISAFAFCAITSGLNFIDILLAQKLNFLAYSVEVKHIFWLGVIVQFGIILVVKLKGVKKDNQYQRMISGIFALCARRLVKLTQDAL
jgi:hypothetical protein